MSTKVLLPNDKYLARPHIVSWLGYPNNTSQRERTHRLIRDWADYRNGVRTKMRKDRLDAGLVQLGKIVDRQLLSGEVFRQQILAGTPGISGFTEQFFGNTSDTNFAKRLAAYSGKPEDYSNEHRDYWRYRLPSMTLAIGAVGSIRNSPRVARQMFKEKRRPALHELIFDGYDWVSRAIEIAEQNRCEALKQGHAEADKLLSFQIDDRF